MNTKPTMAKQTDHRMDRFFSFFTTFGFLLAWASRVQTLSIVQAAALTKQQQQRVALIFYNPSAGKSGGFSQDEIDTIHRILEPEIQVKLIKTRRKNPEEHCRKILKAFKRKVDNDDDQEESSSSNSFRPLVVAAGGDGTVSAVARAVLHSDGLTLGVIPRGTANAFAVALNIPSDLEEACETLRAGYTRHVDAAQGQPGDAMTLLAGLGFEANMVHAAAQGRFKKWLGRLAYIWGGAKQVVRPQAFPCRVKIDQQPEIELEAHGITVAAVAPSGSISAQGTGNVIADDGLLDITIQTGTTMWESLNAMIHLLGSALVNQPTETDNILKCRARRVEIETKSRQRVVVDGELFRKRKKFVYQVLPAALEVVVAPPSSTQDDVVQVAETTPMFGLE